MTRENKLALVVGFGLVLLVGILVSDHFSPARGDRAAAPPAATAPFDGARAEASDLVPLAPPAGEAFRPSARTREEARLQTAALRTATIGGERTPPGPVEPVVPQRPATADGTPSGAAGAIEMGGALPRTIDTDDALLHTVRPGDSLAAICRAYYDDGGLARGLADFNDIDDPSRIREGQVLRLPRDPRVLGGRGPLLAAGGGAAAPERAGERGDTPGGNAGGNSGGNAGGRSGGSAAEPRTYVVRSGDILGRIAQEQVGTVRAVDEIVAMNRDLIDSPDDIRVGMTLRLPPRRDG